MCLGFDCLNGGPRMDHFSGSWLQASTTGPLVFLGFGVGMVIDPTTIEIDCVYPLDAGTALRGANGCGDFEPSSWITSLRNRLWLYWQKTNRFRNKRWEDIPCSELFFPDDDGQYANQARVPFLIDKTQLSWKTITNWEKRLFDKDMGHSVCHDDTEPTFDSLPDFCVVPYAGVDSWMPSEWQTCMEKMQSIIDMFPPTTHSIWNEVVMPQTSKEGLMKQVLAVFYTHPVLAKFAKQEAQKLGGKPILEFAAHTPSRLFQCNPEIEPYDSAA